MDRLMQPKVYTALDAMRLYCACLVVVLHVMETPDAGIIWQVLKECFFVHAVPFFFVVSGFFFAKKLYASEHKLRAALQYAKKQLLLYAAWCVLWLPNLIGIYRTKYPDVSLVRFLALLFRRIVFAGEGVYWYILVLAEGAVVLGILLHFKKEKLLWFLAPVGLLLRYSYDYFDFLPVCSQINAVFYTVFSWSNNFIMAGIPFMAAGVFFAKYEDNLRLRAQTAGAVYLAASTVHVALFLFVKHGFFTSGFLFPLQTLALFYAGLRMRPQRLTTATARTLRECSAVIYFMHTVFIYAIFDYFFTVNAPVSLKFFGSIGLSLLTYAFVRYSNIKPLCWLLGVRYKPQKQTEELSV